MRFPTGQKQPSPAPGFRITTALLVAVSALGLSLRLLYVHGTLRSNPTAKVWAVNGDAYSYRHLGHNLRAYGRYTRDEEGSRYTAILRPPLYPAVLAMLEWADWLPDGALWLQAGLGALIPPCVAWLAWVAYRRRRAMALAGLLAALSPTGIAISAAVLPDLLFAFLFLCGFGAMVFTIGGDLQSWWRGGGAAGAAAGLLFGLAALAKPALTFWPFVLVAVWWLVARALGTRVRWGGLVACVAVQGAMMLGWCARNYASEGIFTFSAIPAQNLRNMVVPRMQVWRKLGRKPSVREVGGRYVKVGLETKAFLHDPNHSIKDLIAEQWSRGFAAVRADPWLAARVYLQDVLGQIPARRDVYDRQLRDVANGGAFDPWERRVFDVIFALGAEPPAQPPRWVPFGMAAAALVLPWWVPRSRRDAAWRRRVRFDLALAITYLYFLALAGTTYAQGTRVMYPAQFAGTLLMVSAVVRRPGEEPTLRRQSGANHNPWLARQLWPKRPEMRDCTLRGSNPQPAVP